MKYHFCAKRNGTGKVGQPEYGFVDGIYDTNPDQETGILQTVEEIYTNILAHAKETLKSKNVTILSLTKLED